MAPAALLVFLLLSVAATAASVDDDVHDLLQELGFPPGLLPRSVVGYDHIDDKFRVELAAPCYLYTRSGHHLVHYNKVITGTFTIRKLSGIDGILAEQSEKLRDFEPITDIVAHPSLGAVEFRGSFLSVDLPAADFEDIPVCHANTPLRLPGGNDADVHDILRELKLPPGLLPRSVVGYDHIDDKFRVELAAPCYLYTRSGHHLVHYNKVITGTFAIRKLSGIDGILAEQSEKLGDFEPITDIVAHPSHSAVEFRSSFISVELPAADFEDIPVCHVGGADGISTSF